MNRIYEAFVDELRKIGAWKPGQQGSIPAEIPEKAKQEKPTITIHGPRGGIQYTKDVSKALQAGRAGRKISWAG